MPEKRVQVGYEGKKQISGDQISPLSDVMKKVLCGFVLSVIR